MSHVDVAYSKLNGQKEKAKNQNCRYDGKKKRIKRHRCFIPESKSPFLMPTRHKAIHGFQTNKLFEHDNINTTEEEKGFPKNPQPITAFSSPSPSHSLSSSTPQIQAPSTPPQEWTNPSSQENPSQDTHGTDQTTPPQESASTVPYPQQNPNSSTGTGACKDPPSEWRDPRR